MTQGMRVGSEKKIERVDNLRAEISYPECCRTHDVFFGLCDWVHFAIDACDIVHKESREEKESVEGSFIMHVLYMHCTNATIGSYASE